MGKNVFKKETGKTKRHDYVAGKKMHIKKAKTVSKGKKAVVAEPKKVKMNLGSMYIHQVTNVKALGADAVKLPNTKHISVYKRARNMV